MRAARFRERTLAYLFDLVLVAAIGWALGLPVGGWAVLLFAYTALSLWAFTGRTPGKILLRLRVIGTGSDDLTTWQYILRPFIALLEIALLFGGFVYALFSRERLALHDLILGTRVVKTSEPKRRPAAARRRQTGARQTRNRKTRSPQSGGRRGGTRRR